MSLRISGMCVLLLVWGTGLLPLQAEPSPEVSKYHEMLRRKPQAGVVMQRLMDAWMKDGTKESLQSFLTAQTVSPTATAADSLILAVWYSANGQDHEALTACRDAVKFDPSSALAHLRLAEAAARMKLWPAALEAVTKATGLQGELEVDAARLHAELLWRLERGEEARQVFHALVLKHPDELQLRDEYVDLLSTHGMGAEAAKACREMVELTKDPLEKALARVRLAKLLAELRNTKEALDQLKLSLAQSGTDSWLEGEVLDRMEQIHRRSNRMRDYMELLTGLAKSQPQRIAIQRRRMKMLAEAGNREAAGKIAKDLLQRTPGRRDVREDYITLLESGGNLPGAITEVEALHLQHPEDAELLLRLAGLHARSASREAARAALEKYLKLQPEDVNATMQAARLLERSGFGEDAAGLYREWLQGHPGDVLTGLSLASLLHRSQDAKGALSIWKDLAKAGDAAVVGQVANAMSHHGEALAAFELLQTRLPEMSGDRRFLAQICQAAIEAGQESLAAPWLRQHAALMKTVGDLEETLALASRILSSPPTRETMLAEDGKVPPTLLGQVVLHAMALDLTQAENAPLSAGSPSARADAVLEAWGDKRRDPTKPMTAEEQVIEAARVKLHTRHSDWARVAAILSGNLNRPGGHTPARFQALTDASTSALDYKVALGWAAQWKAAAPTSFTPWKVTALLLRKTGRTNEMLEVMRDAARRFPDLDEPALNLATELSRHARTGEALETYEGLMEKRETAAARLGIAGLMVSAAKQGKQEEALLQEWKQRQRRQPESAEPWRMLALLYSAMAKGDEEIAALSEASRLEPENTDTLRQLAAAQDARGDTQRALTLYRQAVRLEASPKSQQAYAHFLLKRGEYAEALPLFEEVSTDPSTTPDDVEELADVLMAAGRWKDAARMLEKPLEAFPDHARLLYQRAVALEEGGRLREAEQLFARILATNAEKADAAPLPELRDLRLHADPAGQRMWGRMLERGELAYAHRKFRDELPESAVRAWESRAGPARHLVLPQCREEAHIFALRHLSRIAELRRIADPSARPAVGPEAVPLAGLWQQLSMGLYADNGMPLRIRTRQIQEHLPLLADWVRGRLSACDLMPGGSRILLEQAGKSFAETDPGLAAEAALLQAVHFGDTPEIQSDAVRRALQLASREGASGLPLSTLAGAVLRGRTLPAFEYLPVSKMPLTPENETLLIEAMQSWARKGAVAQPEGAFMVAEVSTVLLERKQWQPWIQFMEEVLPLLRRNEAALEQLATRWDLDDLDLSALPFPPEEIPGSGVLPRMLLPPKLVSGAAALPEDLPAGFGGGVKDPLLRLLCRHLAGDSAGLMKESELLLAAAPGSHEALYLRASVVAMYGSEENLASSIRQWMVAPADGAANGKRALHLLALAARIELPLEPETMPVLLEAARHLSVPGNSAPERARVHTIKMLQERGYVQPAQILAGATQGQARTAPFSTALTAIPVSEAERVLAQVETLPMERRAGFLVEALARPAHLQLEKTDFHSLDSSPNTPEGWATLRLHVSTYRALGEEVGKFIEEKVRSSQMDGQIATVLLERLSLSGSALMTALLKAQSEDPGNLRIRYRALRRSLLHAEDMTAAKRLYLSAPWEDRLRMGLWLARPPESYLDLRYTLVVARLAAELMKEAAATDETPSDLAWVEIVVNGLPWDVHGFHQQHRGAESILEDESTIPEAELFGTLPTDPTTLQLHHDLNQALRDLCEAGTAIPEFAGTAFPTLAGMALRDEGNLKRIATRAREVLEAGSTLERSRTVLSMAIHDADPPLYLWSPSPLEFLAYHASLQKETGEVHVLMRDLAKVLGEAELESLVDAVKSIGACPDEQFVVQGQKLQQKHGTFIRRFRGDPGVLIAQIWKARGLKCDPVPAILPAGSLDTTAEVIAGNGLRIALHALAVRGDIGKTRALLAKAFEAILGPRSQWSNVREGSASIPARPVAKAQVLALFRSLADISARHPALIFAALELAEEAGPEVQEQLAQSGMLPGWITDQGNRNLALPSYSMFPMSAFLAASPWLAPDRPFWDCRIGGAEANTLLNAVAFGIESLDRERQSEALGMLDRAATRNAGAAALRAVARSEPEALLAVLPRIEQKPEKPSETSLRALHTLLRRSASWDLIVRSRESAPNLFKGLDRIAEVEAGQMAARVLKAQRAEELEWEDAKFESVILETATALTRSNRPLAAQFLSHAAQLVAAKEVQSGWKGSEGAHGWSSAAEIVHQWSDGNASLDVIAVACDVYHRPEERVAVSAATLNQPSWGASLNTFWRESGGIFDPGKGLRRLMQGLHDRLSIKHAPLLTIAFLDFQQSLDAWQRDEVLGAAKRMVEEKSELSLYATWFVLAARLKTLEDGSRPEKYRGPDETLSKSCLALLKDETVNPLVRVVLAGSFVSLGQEHLSPEVMWEAMNLAVQVLEKGWPTGDVTMSRILHAVNTLPHEDGHKAAASRWLAAWLSFERSGNAAQPNQGYSAAPDYQMEALTFAARSLDDAGLRHVMETLTLHQQSSAGAMMVLLRHDRSGIARELLLRGGKRLHAGSGNGFSPSGSDLEKLKQFAMTIPDRDLGMVALVMGGAMRALGKPHGTWTDDPAAAWNLRMADHARLLLEHRFQDKELRERLLNALADAPAAVMVLKPELMERDLRQLARQASYGGGQIPTLTQLRYPMELVLADLAKAVRQTPPQEMQREGTVFPGIFPTTLMDRQRDFQTLLERVDTGRSSRSTAECIRLVEGNLFEVAALTSPALDSRSLAGFLPAWNKVLRLYGNAGTTEESLGVATQIVLAGLSGKGAEVSAWREDIPHYRRDALKAQFLSQPMLISVAREFCRLEGGKARSMEDRLKLLRHFSEDPWAKECLQDQKGLIALIVEHQLLTLEEVFSQAQALVEMFPHRGQVAGELAALHRAHGKDEAVMPLLQKALLQDESHEASRADWTLRQVRWLQEQGLQTEARRVYQSFMADLRDPKVRAELEQITPP